LCNRSRESGGCEHRRQEQLDPSGHSAPPGSWALRDTRLGRHLHVPPVHRAASHRAAGRNQKAPNWGLFFRNLRTWPRSVDQARVAMPG
jgi:hypothetical protein